MIRLSRLKLSGFKSFVDPSELVIEEGLTGVVGPNGCGKSNVVEALRWVMGETSSKSMRASGMDDVIFAGASNRPARNVAEVVLHLDNRSRAAPAAFNDSEALEVSRRIERECGSQYRVNGRDVRARDVQLLFADAATGARSSAFVRQGHISDLISAKPEARRRVLEDAAGISGLHSRRHEAEVRLRGAETNLERLEDVIGQLGSQLDSLKKQARQAERFKTLSAEIRKLEALALYLRWRAASEARTEAETALDVKTREVAERTKTASETNRVRAIAAHSIPNLREEEASAAAKLRTLQSARDRLSAEAEQATRRKAELDQLLEQLEADMERERSLHGETLPLLEGLTSEIAELTRDGEKEAEKATAITEKAAAAAQTLAENEARLQFLTDAIAIERAAADQRAAAVEKELARAAKLAEALARAEAERTLLAQQEGDSCEDDIEKSIALASQALEDAETALTKSTEDAQAHESALAEIREGVQKVERHLAELEAEARTLEKVLGAVSETGIGEPVIAFVKVASGYETALGAVFGEELDASEDPASPVHWRMFDSEPPEPSLPEGATPLTVFVDGPEALARRLAYTGVVEDEQTGARLQATLKPGQRLVTKDGALWRWDGFCAGADAPSRAAQKLAQQNRLEELRALIGRETEVAATARNKMNAIKAAFQAARQDQDTLRKAIHEARSHHERERERMREAERKREKTAARLLVIDETVTRLTAEKEECGATLETLRTEAEQAAAPDSREAERTERQGVVDQDRDALATIRAEEAGITREAADRRERLERLDGEREMWMKRLKEAEAHGVRLTERKAAAKAERKELEDKPFILQKEKRAIEAQLEEAEAARKAAADILAKAETELREADNAERQAQAALSGAREERAAAEVRAEAAISRQNELSEVILETLGVPANRVTENLDIPPESDLPPLETIDERIVRLKRDRERLGGVNLRAEQEAGEVEDQHGALLREREDLEQAIGRLRHAIQKLNREGRERLLKAFEEVKQHFSELFVTLFGGGHAELTLTEAEDPLEAGLDIIARPPGKKPQSLSLLSGGEQALTASALIFAVFMTKPAPICVLDEVDAPLDDHNVNRFCDLLDKIVGETSTRFLVITHNPITMARMNRLFGVTMAEKGVSQLVSVDLETAESFREAV